jgi:hypothetical protein
MTTELNDMQRQAYKRVQKAADDYRASLRPRAEFLVDSILLGQKAGMSRDEIVDTITRALANRRLGQ